MKYGKFTDAELDLLASAAIQITDVYEAHEEWRKLILDDDIYRAVTLMKHFILAEERKRILKK